ncbi:hypothetical protein C8Q75DRAFT_373702 [Abortiporus biennis]|nr:hypothetical protein C8Q75DRAFT_373702 [Abortiporus biennis]
MFFHFTNQVVLFATLICTAMIVSSLPIPFTKSTNLNIVARDGQGAVVSSGFTRHGSVAMYRARSESKDASANFENAMNEIHKAVQSAAPQSTTTMPASPIYTEHIAKRQADGGNTDTVTATSIATSTDNSSASATGTATLSSADATSTSLPTDSPSVPNDETNRKSGHKKHNHKNHYGSGGALGQGKHDGKRVPCSNNTMENTTATATVSDVAATPTDAAQPTAADNVTSSDGASAMSTSTTSYPAAAPTGTSTASSIAPGDGTNPHARSLLSHENNKDDSTKHDKRFVSELILFAR